MAIEYPCMLVENQYLVHFFPSGASFFQRFYSKDMEEGEKVRLLIR
jgi:hypothetical protein